MQSLWNPEKNEHLTPLSQEYTEGLATNFPLSVDLYSNTKNIQSPSLIEIVITHNCVFALYIPVKHLIDN